MRSRSLGGFVLLTVLASFAHGPGYAQEPGERYALLVGVRKYAKTSELRELHYTERDMEELAEVLRAGGYSPENLVLMTQTAGVENTRFLPIAVNIRKELKAILRDRVKADSVLVAFAGHGVQFRGSDEVYFCPADARPDDKATLIPLNEVYQALAECEAQFKLLLSDACRNDPVVAVTRRATVNLESVTRPQLLKPPGGVAVLFSCSEGELAFENDTLKHGVFFHFVIQGLRGEADFNHDQQIALEELTFYIKRQVLDFVRAEYDGVRQMPVLKGEVGGLPVLASLDRSKLKLPETITNSIGMRLTLIPAGEFLMGSPDSDKDAEDDEKPRHRVRITRPFYLGKYEVTQAEYEAMMRDNPSYFEGKPKNPVENVSWVNALRFCNQLSEREGLKPYYEISGETAQVPAWNGAGYRLPTEAEWEYACRAGTATRYSFGDDEASLGEFCWFDGNSDLRTHEVGQKRANGFGLHDMHGNVWEWCGDWYADGYYKEPPVDDPRGPSRASIRVIRGGSWYRDPRLVRSADRLGFRPDYRSSNLGFRVARVQSGG